MKIKINCPICNDFQLFDFKDVSEFTKEQMTDGKTTICPVCKTTVIIRTSGLPLHSQMPDMPLYQFIESAADNDGVSDTR